MSRRLNFNKSPFLIGHPLDIPDTVAINRAVILFEKVRYAIKRTYGNRRVSVRLRLRPHDIITHSCDN